MSVYIDARTVAASVLIIKFTDVCDSDGGYT